MPMATTRLTKKNQPEETTQEPPSQRKQAEGRYWLQVDRQTKASYPTWEAAEKAGLAIKKKYPVVQVSVYDQVDSANKTIELPQD
jgi:hypothetical protein